MKIKYETVDDNTLRKTELEVEEKIGKQFILDLKEDLKDDPEKIHFILSRVALMFSLACCHMSRHKCRLKKLNKYEAKSNSKLLIKIKNK